MSFILPVLNMSPFFFLLAYSICSWKEFCQDISLEKAGWYLEMSAVRRLDARVENCNPEFKNFGNSSPVLSSEFHFISSPNGSISQVRG